MLAYGIKEALHLIKQGNLQHKLFINMDYLYHNLSSHGLIKYKTIINTPIIPIVLQKNDKVLYVAHHMALAGFDIKAIRPPSVPINEARLRITANINHNRDLIDNFIASLIKLI
jgi:7-keto-8-aminopelargonate synthetase-like enzyme